MRADANQKDQSGDRLDRLSAPEVDSGRYGNASEVVREGLRLMEQRNREEQARLKWLRGAVRAGLGELERGKASHSSESMTSKSTSTGWAGSQGRACVEAQRWISLEPFGERAAECYRGLIKQALRDVAAVPDRAGSREGPELAPGVRTYHLVRKRPRRALGTFSQPRHFLVYRCGNNISTWARDSTMPAYWPGPCPWRTGKQERSKIRPKFLPGGQG